MHKVRMQNVAPGKSDIRYWQKRVRKTGSRGNENPFYSVQLQHAGRRMELSLGTANQIEAAARAKERYLFLVGNGWPEFLAKYRGAGQSAAATVSSTLSVGEFLEAVRSQTELESRTVEGYAKKFRQIVAEIMNVKGSKTRFDYRKGGLHAWLDAVHSVPLASVTPDKVRDWKKRFIDEAGKNEIKRRSRTVSCNSIIRQARSLFSRRNVLDKLAVALPPVLPFDGVNVERRDRKSTRLNSRHESVSRMPSSA